MKSVELDTPVAAVVRRAVVGAQVELLVFGRLSLRMGDEVMLINACSVFGL